MPIRFDVKLNAEKQTISDIEYEFVKSESAPDFSPTSTEEVLMKELMKQIGKDYKTDNIVIAIDGFEDFLKSTIKKNLQESAKLESVILSGTKSNLIVVLNDRKFLCRQNNL